MKNLFFENRFINNVEANVETDPDKEMTVSQPPEDVAISTTKDTQKTGAYMAQSAVETINTVLFNEQNIKFIKKYEKTIRDHVRNNLQNSSITPSLVKLINTNEGVELLVNIHGEKYGEIIYPGSNMTSIFNVVDTFVNQLKISGLKDEKYTYTPGTELSIAELQNDNRFLNQMAQTKDIDTLSQDLSKSDILKRQNKAGAKFAVKMAYDKRFRDNPKFKQIIEDAKHPENRGGQKFWEYVHSEMMKADPNNYVAVASRDEGIRDFLMADIGEKRDINSPEAMNMQNAIAGKRKEIQDKLPKGYTVEITPVKNQKDKVSVLVKRPNGSEVHSFTGNINDDLIATIPVQMAVNDNNRGEKYARNEEGIDTTNNIA